MPFDFGDFTVNVSDYGSFDFGSISATSSAAPNRLARPRPPRPDPSAGASAEADRIRCATRCSAGDVQVDGRTLRVNPGRRDRRVADRLSARAAPAPTAGRPAISI
jgi:hypothetical protein